MEERVAFPAWGRGLSHRLKAPFCVWGQKERRSLRSGSVPILSSEGMKKDPEEWDKGGKVTGACLPSQGEASGSASWLWTYPHGLLPLSCCVMWAYYSVALHLCYLDHIQQVHVRFSERCVPRPVDTRGALKMPFPSPISCAASHQLHC